MLSVLLILGMEVVNGILHNILGVHGFFERRANGLEGDWTSVVGIAGIMSIGIGRNIESESEGDGSKEHFNADEEVLPSGGNGSTSNNLFSLSIVNWVDSRSSTKNSDEESLPERQENDTLDSEEFENRTIRAEKITGGGVEQEHSVESKRDGDIVDESDVDVSLVEAPVSVFVFSNCGEHQRDDSHDWFDEAELESCLLAESKKLDGVLLASQTAGARQIVGRANRLSTNLGHYIALTTQVLIAQRQERVDHKSFVAVANGVEVDVDVVREENER